MAELPPVVPGEPVDASTFGNPVIDRVLSRYADNAARDAAVPLPQTGDFAWIESTDELQVYNGSEWQTFYPNSDSNRTTVTEGSIDVSSAGAVVTLAVSLVIGVGVLGGFTLPAELRPQGGPVRAVLPAYLGGFGAKAGEVYHVRINTSGTFEVQATDPNYGAGDRVMGSITYARNVVGI